MNKRNLFLALLTVLIALGNSGCFLCDQANSCEDCEEDTGSFDTDDDTDDDDADQTVTMVGEYIAGGTFSGAALSMDAQGNPYICAGKSRHLRVYELSGTQWAYDLVAFGKYANPSLAIDADGTQHISYYDWYAGHLYYAKGSGDEWETLLIDNGGDVGHYSSIAVDPQGNAHIAYSVEISRDPIGLKYATNETGMWQVFTADSAIGTGGFPSLSLDSTNNPYVTYNDESSLELRLARNVSGIWEKATLADGVPYNRSSSIAIDSADVLHLAYRANDGDLHLRYATGSFDSLAWEVVDNTISLGDSIALACDNAGIVHIAYFNSTAGTTMYANNASKAWTITELDDSYPVSIAAESVSNVAISVGNFGLITNKSGDWKTSWIDKGYNVDDCAIALDSGDAPSVAFLDRTTQALRFAESESGDWERSIIVSPIGGTTRDVDMAVDSSDFHHISFYDDLTYELKYATDKSGSWDILTIDSENLVGTYNSITLDKDDYVHITYYDESVGNFKYANNNSGTWKTYLLDSQGICGLSSSIAAGSEKTMHAAYLDLSDSAVNYGAGKDSSWNFATAADQPGEYAALALDDKDAPHVAFYSAGLNAAYIDDDQWTTVLVDAMAVSSPVDIAFSADGEFSIVYQALSHELTYSWGAKESWQSLTVDDIGQVGAYVSIDVSSTQERFIAYVSEGAVWLATIQ